MTTPGPNPGGDFISRDKSIYGDEVHGHKFTTHSPQQELRDYLAAAVPSYATAQMQRILNLSSQQSIKEPYKFLDSFDLEDANFFFGRNTAVQALYEVVTNNRLTVLHAKSGAGKTSLLNAGLAPRLITTGRLPVYARAFQDPVQAVKRTVAPGSAGPWPEMLHRLSLSEFLGLVKHYLPRVQELVLVLDQFEEFFVFWPLREQRQPFIADFAQCYRDVELPVRFIISLRKDYYSDLAEFEPYISSIFRNQLRLDPMERVQAAEAITAPIVRLGKPVTYAPDLLDTILDDLGGSGMELPHMQIICTKLYNEALSTGARSIGLPIYETLGRAPGILSNYLNGILALFPGRGGTVAKSVLKELVSSEATKRTLPYATLASRIEATAPDLNDTLTRLVNARLLRRDEVEGEVVYEMAHEYLITEIKHWINTSDLAFKQVEELLSREVTNWRIHRTLIPRDRLDMIFAQRTRLGRVDDETAECLLLSALQSKAATEEWMGFIASTNIQPLCLLLQHTPSDSANASARRYAVKLVGLVSDGRAIETLIVALKDVDREVCRAAAEALGKLGDTRAVEPLITALKDLYEDVRRAAAEALGKLRDTRAVDPLIAALKDVGKDVRRAAAEALSKMGDAAVGPLITALKDANEDVRRVAAEVLANLGGAAVDPLITALKDMDKEVRRVAAEVLGKLGGTRAVDQLITALKDTDWRVRRAAAEALGKLGDTRAVEPLITVLTDTDWRVRSAAVEVLGKLGGIHVVDPLITALEDPDEDVRRAAAEALGKLGDTRAVEPLITALKDSNGDVRRAAAEVLGKLRDTRAVDPLITALKDPYRDVRRAAAEVLGKFGDAAIGHLITALMNSDRDVRRAAAELLANWGDARAVKPLITALKDADKDVRKAAAEALGKLGGGDIEPLIAALRDPDRRVRWAVVELLGKLGDSRAVEPLIAVLKDEDMEVRRIAGEALLAINTPGARSAVERIRL